ncbi:MAG: hypothetical protein V4489_03395 [Chlamydiota bacterium]
MICLSVVLCIIFLFSVSSSQGRRMLQEDVGLEGQREKVKVVISGAVLRPGEYEVEVGSSLKKVLSRAGFRSFADKKAIYSKKILLNSCEIFVPEKKKSTRQRSCLACD